MVLGFQPGLFGDLGLLVALNSREKTENLPKVPFGYPWGFPREFWQ